MTSGTSVDGAAYREAMARLAGAVHLVTTDGPGGRAGFTATAVCSVSDAPPTLLVCINRDSSAYPAFDRNGRLCVNLLAAGTKPWRRLLGAGRSMSVSRKEPGTRDEVAARCWTGRSPPSNAGSSAA